MLSSRGCAALARIREGAPRRLARRSRQERRCLRAGRQGAHVCWMAWELGDDRSWPTDIRVLRKSAQESLGIFCRGKIDRVRSRDEKTRS